MFAGTAKAATTITGAATAIPLKPQGEKLNERYQSECQMPYNQHQQHDKKAKQHDGRER
jgi:hypothetical protein